MMSRAFQHFNDVPLSVFGMLLFLTVFVGVVIQVFARDKEEYAPLAAMPLEKEEIIHE